MNAPARKNARIQRSIKICVSMACIWGFICAGAGAQSGANESGRKASAEASPGTAAEVNTRDSTATFQVRVNSIPIRVVVRDAQGRPVGNLRKEDFQVYQDRKLQVISHFSIQSSAPAAQLKSIGEGNAGARAEGEAGSVAPFAPASRFVALLFDDAHLAIGDLQNVRSVATRFIDTSLEASDRVAVFTTSGQTELDFTDDRTKLREVLNRLLPRAVTAGESSGAGDCPSINYLQADLIVNKRDSEALSVAVEDALDCQFQGNTQELGQAQALAEGTALQILTAGDAQTEYSLRRLQEIVQRVSVMPGERSLVLVSPGFLAPTREIELSQLIDRATRENVYINTLDARGLYTVDPIGDISRPDPVTSARVGGKHDEYRIEGQRRQSDVLMDLADGTGGLAFANSNDLDKGLRLVAGTPEVSYLLAITPDNFKYDGKFHSLSVKLLTKEKYKVQSRRGYYAPKHGETPDELAKQDLEDAVFSQEEQHNLPVELHTQYYKVDPADAKLAVMTHVDIERMRFDKENGRNHNELTVVAALFDRNGNYITGNQKVITFRLLDSTLQRLDRTGVTVKTSFDVKPGGYVVRLVVRDSNAAQLSTENGVVEIP